MPIKTIRQFIQAEFAAGIILFGVTIFAIALDNSSLKTFYESLFQMSIGWQIGTVQISKSLVQWINEGLMTLFFLLVGLEIKREIVIGELNSATKVMLPALAALGGMIVPALLYILINWQHPHAIKGWAIPTATDIAFALGVISLLGRRIPLSIKIFLTALAIFDDIGAIIIIAVFYTTNISIVFLLLALLCIGLLWLLNRIKVDSLLAYLFVGFLLWFCVLESGVHAVLSGVITALAIPLHSYRKKNYSPLIKLESKLQPWVALGILPIFALANAGISFAGLSSQQILSPIAVGIVIGLFIGKQMGVFITTWLAVKFRMAPMPNGASWPSIYGTALLAGIGFTISLFIGTLAFPEYSSSEATSVRLGVMLGSLLSGILGYSILRLTNRTYVRHR